MFKKDLDKLMYKVFIIYGFILSICCLNTPPDFNMPLSPQQLLSATLYVGLFMHISFSLLNPCVSSTVHNDALLTVAVQ